VSHPAASPGWAILHRVVMSAPARDRRAGFRMLLLTVTGGWALGARGALKNRGHRVGRSTICTDLASGRDSTRVRTSDLVAEVPASALG
jgi:hypothetical protein